jgi:hypothetical protein
VPTIITPGELTIALGVPIVLKGAGQVLGHPDVAGELEHAATVEISSTWPVGSIVASST